MDNLNTNVINGLLVIGGGLLLLLGGGGIAAVIAYIRQHGKDVERAFQSTDPETQQVLLDLVKQGQAALNIANQIILAFGQIIQLGVDVTDGDLNTPADPQAMLVKAAKLEAKAEIIRTTALRVQSLSLEPMVNYDAHGNSQG